MKKINRSLWLVTVAVVLCFAPNAFATPTTTMTLTGVGDSATVGNVYVNPYTATIGTLKNVPVICDDWSDNSYVNQTWTATVLSASTAGNAALGTPLFGNNQALYNEAAFLGSKLMANPTNTTVQTETSFALWALTYPYATDPEIPAPLDYLASTFSDGTSDPIYQATVILLNQAMTEGNYDATGWTIYTPVSGTATNPANDGDPQEFLVYTPEPSTLASLALGICGLLGLGAWQRRKSAFNLAA